MRVFIETYGCQMNVADSETMAGVLERAGMSLCERAEDADAILVNTCAIREHAEQRVLGRLGDYARLKASRPGLVVGVAGCMAQHLRSRLLDKARVLDLVVGPDGYRRLPELLARAASEPVAHVRLDRDETYGDLEPRRAGGVRAWITVQRGCDKFCTYCVVPYTRGRERSLPLADLVAQVRSAAAAGYREVVFLGQTVNSYRSGDVTFPMLLRRVARVPGIRRVRFTSPHPNDVTPELVEVMAEEPAVCEHLHLPLQAGSDRVLAAMHRGYTAEHYLELLAAARAAIHDPAVTTDIIVGFPGETDDDFERTLEVTAEAAYDSAYTFIYSPRPGTEAASMPGAVPPDVVRDRFDRLVAAQEAVSLERNRATIGHRFEVLVEQASSRKDAGRATARTRTNKIVHLDGDGDGVAAGAFLNVRVTGAHPHHLDGVPV